MFDSQWLVSAGAYTEARQFDGFTALHSVTCLGHLDTCRELLKAGASIRTPCIDGWTPLHNAVCFGHMDVIELLLHQPDCPINEVTNVGDSVLHMASSNGRYDIVDVGLIYLHFVSSNLCVYPQP